jgi:hypothetical protein
MIDGVYSNAIDLAIEKWESLPDFLPLDKSAEGSIPKELKKRIEEFIKRNGFSQDTHCTLCAMYRGEEAGEEADWDDECTGCIIAEKIGDCLIAGSPYVRYIEGEASKNEILNCLYEEKERLEKLAFEGVVSK